MFIASRAKSAIPPPHKHLLFRAGEPELGTSTSPPDEATLLKQALLAHLSTEVDLRLRPENRASAQQEASTLAQQAETRRLAQQFATALLQAAHTGSVRLNASTPAQQSLISHLSAQLESRLRPENQVPAFQEALINKQAAQDTRQRDGLVSALLKIATRNRPSNP